ncbi:hypothetical protein M378DRAFT_70399 [Amanita muscaria Koide BX008]|uniref:Calcineurin-like phosphoesterase domain-containing protein n=1 Tax=Amanita muscaria (strain Koide BX008) TaxID=946122 RepID=A0A0C2SZ44_AMAMK|nr:hypothetical protein M378DRAFT_70399 [Amanita muscaria Koide BX008]
MTLRDIRALFRSSLYSRRAVQSALRVFWIAIVVWYELGTYYFTLFSCRWPNLGANTEPPSHVLLLSDTQVPATVTSYSRFVGKTLAWQRFLAYINLRKSWRVASWFKPQAVVFLGDMLAAGKTIRSAKEYEQAVQRFKSIFALPGIPQYYIPGNTDISLGMGRKHSRDVKAFFSQSFGPLNQVFSIQNHTFVALDAPGLVDEDYHRAAQGIEYDDWSSSADGPVTFVRSVSPDQQPLILLSHIPLSRPITASCGPLREKGTIHRNVGHGYQSMLGKQTTQFLLKTLRPSLIFSGDNRDYCEYGHSFTTLEGEKLKRGAAREVTVKSFSMSRHIRRPGFQLLSLANPSSVDGDSFADVACLLPDQDRIYSTVYPTLFVLTLLGLFILNKNKFRRLKKHQLSSLQITPQNGHNSLADANPWTPRTARTPFTATHPVSLNPSLNGHKLRTFSYPTTPLDSLPSHYVTQSGESDDEDALYPSYSSHHLHHEHELQHHEEWPVKQEEEEPISTLGQKSGWKPVDAQKWDSSWTFVFRGRRRRLTLPSWKSLVNCYELCGDHVKHTRQSRGIVMNGILDMVPVLWPAGLTWLAITWFQL